MTEVKNQTAANPNDDEESVKAVADEIIEDCKEAFGVFVDQHGQWNRSHI